MNKLKVLEIGNGLGVGGAGRTLQSFCRYLDKEKFEVKVACVFDGGKRAEELRREGFSVDIFNGNLISLTNYLKTEYFDVMHIHRRGGFEPHWVEILKDKIVPLVVETNVFAEFDSATNPFIDVHLCKSMMMLNERYLPNLSRTERENFWPKYRVLYNPVDVALFEKYRLTSDKILQKRHDLGIKDDELVIGKVGARAAIEKWSWLVVDMLPLLLNEILNVKMIIQAAPEAVIDKLKKTPYADHFIFLPETEDEAIQASYYQLLDVFTHTSKIGEAFGNTLNEAMVWEKPIVTNSTPWADNGQLEQVEHDKNGFIANTPGSFAAATTALLKDGQLRLKMGQTGRHKVETEYSPERTVANLDNIFLGNNSFSFYPSKSDISGYQVEYKSILQKDYIPPKIFEYFKYCLMPSAKFVLKSVRKYFLGK